MLAMVDLPPDAPTIAVKLFSGTVNDKCLKTRSSLSLLYENPTLLKAIS